MAEKISLEGVVELIDGKLTLHGLVLAKAWVDERITQ